MIPFETSLKASGGWPNGLTLGHILVLLEIHGFMKKDWNTEGIGPRWPDYVDDLKTLGFVEDEPERDYQTTPKARCWIDAMMSLPMPVDVVRWEMPSC